MTVYFPTISPAEFEKALRICCLRQAARDVVHPTINHCARSWHLGITPDYRS